MDFCDISCLNVNSIVTYNKRQLFLDLFQQIKSDIFFLSETHLKPSKKFYINNFNIFRQDRIGKNGGGTAIILNEKIKFRNFRKHDKSFEASSIEVFLDNIWITLISIYIPPNTNFDIEQFIDFLPSDQYVICGGDFNSRLLMSGDISNNNNGRVLEGFLTNDHSLKPIFTQFPTCFRSQFGSKIDFFLISSDFLKNYQIEQSLSFSDHCLITLKINFHCNTESLSTDNLIFSYSYANMNKINNFILRELDSLNIEGESNYSDDDLERITEFIDSTFREAVHKFVPKIKIPPCGIILSNQTKSLKKQMRSLSKKYFKNYFSIHANEIKKSYSLVKNMYINSLRFDISVHFKNYISKVQCNADIFEIIRNTSGLKRNGNGNIPNFEIQCDNGNSVLFGQKNANNEFAKHFLFNNHGTGANLTSLHENAVHDSIDAVNSLDVPIIFNDRISPKILSFGDLEKINEVLPDHQANLLTCSEELMKIISGKINKKSSGNDRMPICLFKHFHPNIIIFLSIFFNHLIANSYFPKIWKFAIVTPIPKAGKNLQQIAGWRPISQLNTISKLFEKTIDQRLSHETVELNVLPVTQFGFRNGISTYHALTRFTSDISDALNLGKITTAIAIDVRCAFDSIWHDGLIHKMKNFGYNVILIKLIMQFLNKRSFAVGFGENRSDGFIIPCGVPQGSVLAPKLFNIYLADLPKNKLIKNLQFADDIIFYMRHRAPLAASIRFNTFLNEIVCFYDNWKLAINEDKTQLINFYGSPGVIANDLKKRNRQKLNIMIKNTKLLNVENIKYLGVIFSSNFKFIRHVDHIIKKVNISVAKINHLLKNCLIEPSFKNFMYKCYIRPIIQYAASIWLNPTNLSSHQVERIRILERKILRKTNNIKRNIGDFKHISNSAVYQKSGIRRIDCFLIDNCIRFFKKCLNSTNDFIRGLVEPFRENKYYTPSYIYHLDVENNVYINEKLLIFHRGYKNPHSLVYNMSQ